VEAVRIGIDLGGTKIEGIALIGSEEAARVRVPTPRGDYDATVGAVVSIVHRLEDRIRRRGAVGVGIPGTVSPATGLVKNANSIWLIGRPLQSDLTRALSREVRVANDANCFAISEAADGSAAGAPVVFAAILGTGTGAGVAVGGRVLLGPNGLAGEWGHNALPWAADAERPGPACYCGKRGCIETFLSGPGLASDYERQTGRAMTAPAVVERAAAGEAAAEDAMCRYEDRMARALGSIINVIDPDVIVLGGGMSNVERLYDRVPRLWGQWIFAAGGDAGVRTRFVRARHGDASGVRGAAWLWPLDGASDGASR
jgi:fructokinase